MASISKLPFLKLLFWVSLSISHLLNIGNGERCGRNGPSLKQTQMGLELDKRPTYMVEIQNTCPTCPVIDVHVQCGNFSQALVNPKIFRVLGHNDCVLNSGQPLEPLEKLSFKYSHSIYVLNPSAWYYQCE